MTAVDEGVRSVEPSPREGQFDGRWLTNTDPALRKCRHPVAAAAEVGETPMQVTLLGQDWVLVRINGELVVMEDRCPHRFAPLSFGTIVDGTLECPYHGYRFDGSGHCVRIPAKAPEIPIPIKAPPARDTGNQIPRTQPGKNAAEGPGNRYPGNGQQRPTSRVTVRVLLAASRCRECACRGWPIACEGDQNPISPHRKDTHVFVMRQRAESAPMSWTGQGQIVRRRRATHRYVRTKRHVRGRCRITLSYHGVIFIASVTVCRACAASN
jgi:nitrite reductase/ring-hydroxylating ferredoxin subunit